MPNTRAALRVMLVGLAVVGSALAGSARAAIPADSPEPSAEVRQKMAALHEQMATCLRSNQEFSICQAQMVKSCQEQLGSECRMAGHGGNGVHRMRPMNPPPTDK